MASPNDRYLSVAELRVMGYSIDTTTYPWFAYTGRRFAPTRGFPCTTPAWAPAAP